MNAPTTLHCIRHGKKYVGAECPDCVLERGFRIVHKGILGIALLDKLNAWKRGGSDTDVLLAIDDYIQHKLEADPYPAIMARIAKLMENDPAKGTPEGDELLALVDAAEMYERQRCPELSSTSSPDCTS